MVAEGRERNLSRIVMCIFISYCPIYISPGKFNSVSVRSGLDYQQVLYVVRLLKSRCRAFFFFVMEPETLWPHVIVTDQLIPLERGSWVWCKHLQFQHLGGWDKKKFHGQYELTRACLKRNKTKQSNAKAKQSKAKQNKG